MLWLETKFSGPALPFELYDNLVAAQIFAWS
jgi:hypothetical protein